MQRGLLVAAGLLLALAAGSLHGATRRTNDLLALYYFDAAAGEIIKDRSGVGKAIDLKIRDTGAVRWAEGSLEVRAPTLIRSDEFAAKINEAVIKSGEITIEAWVQPAKTGQSGPARIVTLSKDTAERNFTLGQDGERFDVRLRTTQTGQNGTPSLSSAPKSLTSELTQVVYARNRDGRARVFINGKVSAEGQVKGGTSNWDKSFRLALANELTRDRPWLGTYHLVAIYGRALSSKDITENFAAGVGRTKAPQAVVQRKPAPVVDAKAAAHFDAQIAPILGRHCVDCHGPNGKKGRLDLSQKDAAFAGGKSGKVIVPGKPEESLLWKQIESDVMPDERPALSATEKKLIREWIEAGAVWSANRTAPLAHQPKRDGTTHLVRRLTVPEYIETVLSAVEVDIATDARRLLPPDLRADGFNNTAYNLTVDLGHVEAYAELAALIVSRMDVLRFASDYAKCQKVSDACMRELITSMGKWLLRGPLEEREVTSFLRVAKGVAEQGGDFKQAVGFVLEAMLQSPRFIYRIEKAPDKDRAPVGPYELASRLSYILWGGPPDKQLLRSAEAGELADRGQVQAQVRRMLKDPRAVERSARFVHEWLNLDRLESLKPDKKRFPNWDMQLAADMREETVAFFKEVAWKQNRPLADLMNAQVTYATPRLAQHYGLRRKPAPAGTDALVLYRFEEGDGDTIRDVSGNNEPIDLKITGLAGVKWSKGRLTVTAPTLITTKEPPKRLIDAIRKSKAFTLEAWVTPADVKQAGPARIVTLSSGTSLRNFTLGQDGDKFDVRLRTTRTDDNGLPSSSSPGRSLQSRLTQVVYTRDAAGKATLYIDGEAKGKRDVGGDFSKWDESFQLALANESTKDRPWRGTFHLVAIYSQALKPEELRPGGSGLTRFDLTSVPSRGGLLTQGSALTVGGDQASMVARGLFVLQDFLAGKVEDPPPCVDTTPVPPKPGLSQRAIAQTRLSTAACAGCHAKFEPLAFGLEKFDGLGAYHQKDAYGNQLREDGEILFPGADQPIEFKASAELMDLLAKSERVREVITRKVTQFALGRPLVDRDEPAIEKIHGEAQKNGGTYASLMTAIVMSDLVQMTQRETKQ